MQRLPAFGSVLVELVARFLQHGSRRFRELLAQARERLLLLLNLALKPFRVLLDLRPDLDEQLPLARFNAFQLVVQARLELLDVACPVAEPLLDGSLDGEQLVAEPHGRVALALRDIAPALVGNAPLFLGELRERVCAKPRECPLELLRALLELMRKDGVERALPLLDRTLEHLLLATHFAQDHDAGEQRE